MYYSFYRRVQDAVVPLWNKNVNEYVNEHPDVRKRLSSKEYVTELEIVISATGDLVKTIVNRSCGVAGIDQAAGAAFVQSTPFENPPSGMIGDDGVIVMHWRFVVSVVEQLKYRIEEVSPFYKDDGWPDL